MSSGNFITKRVSQHSSFGLLTWPQIRIRNHDTIYSRVKLSVLQNTLTNTGAHPASYSMGTGAPSTGKKWCGVVRSNNHLHSVPGIIMCGLIPCFPPCLHDMYSYNFTFTDFNVRNSDLTSVKRLYSRKKMMFTHRI